MVPRRPHPLVDAESNRPCRLQESLQGIVADGCSPNEFNNLHASPLAFVLCTWLIAVSELAGLFPYNGSNS